MILDLFRCILAVPYRSFDAARSSQIAFRAHGVSSTLYNCQFCLKWHLRAR